YPYVAGNLVKLQLKTPYDQQTIEVRIIKVFEPFTCSSAMVVRPVCPTTVWEGDVVLKLFDRRFATELRKNESISPWTLDIEQKYHQFILDGDAAKLVAELAADRELPGRSLDTWNSSQEETYLHDYMQGLYETETRVYNTLTDMQGNEIPRLFSCVTVPSSTRRRILCSANTPTFLESFCNIAVCAPRDSWQSICEEAIRIVNLVGDRGILNEDVKTRSFVVQSRPENQFHVFMIDFALCDFREAYEDETEWEGLKAVQDEEGAVGYVMQRKLQGGFLYHRSARYRKLDEKYNTDG
ncbi:hypothetical protein N7453_001819, partial [Penicillium expansum]